MGAANIADRAAMVQRDLVSTVVEMRPTKAKTLATFQKSTRKKQAQLAGIQIAFWRDRANGQTWYNPNAGDMSFKRSIKQRAGAMYAGVVFRNMNIWMEAHMLLDMERGKIPDSYIRERERRIGTHMWKKNMAAIHDGTGGLAKVGADASSTVTVLADNSARGTSKGTRRLQESTPEDPLYYDSVDPTTDTIVATFYISSISSATVFTPSGFTVGAVTDIDTGDWICESGSWKKEMWGLGYHQNDSPSRIYQGADVAENPFLQTASIDAGNTLITPTLIHSAKGIMMTKANLSMEEGELPYVGHITPGNYRTLAKFSYPFRTYEAAGGKANKTYGLPTGYEDGDTYWAVDADYEDAYVDLRERAPFFEYVHKEFGKKTVGGQGRHEWVGAYEAGSTNEYENYNEACNIVWDAAGADGKGGEGGTPNTGVYIKNLAIPAENQAAYGA
jgi:hypothetical protein